MGVQEVDTMSSVIGGLVGLIVLVVAFYLLFRRMHIKEAKGLSTRKDYFVLLLLLGIIIAGDMMRFFTDFDLNLSREYFSSLLTFGLAPVPSNPLFLLHFFLGQVLFIYLPFSKFLHIPGIFFSHALLQSE